jgi:hypothetical protein
MNTFDFFLLQMNDNDSLMAAKSLEMNLRCLNNADAFDNCIMRFESNWPSRAQHEWFAPLIEAIRPFFKPLDQDGDDSYTNPLHEFLLSTFRRLNGGRLYLGAFNLDTDHFSAEELAQPHMQWLAILAKRMDDIQTAFPDNRYAIRLCRVHPMLGIDDEKAIEMNTIFEAEDYSAGMAFTDFIDWYTKSRSHFVLESQLLHLSAMRYRWSL